MYHALIVRSIVLSSEKFIRWSTIADVDKKFLCSMNLDRLINPVSCNTAHLNSVIQLNAINIKCITCTYTHTHTRARVAFSCVHTNTHIDTTSIVEFKKYRNINLSELFLYLRVNFWHIVGKHINEERIS